MSWITADGTIIMFPDFAKQLGFGADKQGEDGFYRVSKEEYEAAHGAI